MNNYFFRYGLIAKEISEDMGCFDKIGFVDDNAKTTPNGIDVLGAFADIEDFACEYSNIIVAIGRPDVRLNLIHKIEETTPCCLLTIIFPSFRVMMGVLLNLWLWLIPDAI